MADRYWVGGSGTWVAGGTTKWSAASALSFTASCSGTTLTTTGSPALAIGMTVWSSTNVSLGTITGGADPTWTVSVGGTYASQAMTAATTGASVPTATDNVIFNTNSSATNAYTVTLSGALSCLDFTVSARTPTFTSTGTLSPRGSFTLASGTVWTGTGAITFAATATGKTITTNGTSLACAITFNGVGGGWTLGSALTSTAAGTSTLTAGAFSTGNFNITLSGSFSGSGSTTRSLTLGSSTINVAGGSGWNTATTTGLTFSAGTSQINLSNTSTTFQSGGLTYNNVSFTSTAGGSAAAITGAATFNSLTFASITSVGLRSVTIASSITVTGTFTCSAGTNATCRNFIAGVTLGTAVTITAAAVSLTDVDFRDITGSGAASWIGTRLGDCGGNTSIATDAPKTVYWNLAGAQNWYSAGWATTSTGTPAINNFPLPQDTATFTDAGSAGTVSMGVQYNIGTIDMSGRTSAMTLATSTVSVLVYGNWLNGSGTTLTGTGTLSFLKRGGTHQITSAGKTFSQPLVVASIGGTVQLQDALTTTSSVTLNNGTLDLNNLTLTAPSFVSSGGNARTIAFGTGSINVTGTGTVCDLTLTTNMTTTGTQVINVSNNTATATTVIIGALSEANSISLNVTTGTYALTLTLTSVRNLNFTGFSGTVSNSGPAICGNVTLAATATYTAGTSAWVFASTSGTKTITTNGVTMDWPLTFNGAGGTWQLQDALTMGSTRAATLMAGTLDLNSKTFTCGTFSSNNLNARTLAFGTGSIVLNAATGTTWNTSQTGNLTVTGTPLVTVAGTTLAQTITPGVPSEANSISFNFLNGSYALTITTTSAVRNLTFSSGYSGTVANTALTIYGNLGVGVNATYTAGANVWTFASTSGTDTITSNGKTLDFPITFNGAGGTWQLQDAMTVGSTRTTTLTNGTLDLNGKTLTSGVFSSSNSNTRTIAFGAGNITLTGAGGTLWTTATTTNLTVTGTPLVNVAYAGATATTITPGSPIEANSISFAFTSAGTYSLTMTAGNWRDLNFTSFFAGTVNNAAQTIYGNLTLSSSATYTAGTNIWTFAATSGTKTITANGKTMDFPVYFDGVGGTWQLTDAMTLGSTRLLRQFNGTLDLNGKTATTGSYETGAGTKNLTFNGGTLICTTSGASAFNNASPAGYTTTAGIGTGTISMTAATAKTFVGGGVTYNCTLNQGGAGALTITGANTFNNITNTVQPTTIQFTAGTTTTFLNGFSLSGTAGNLVTITSDTTAQHTLSKSSGTVDVSYCNISYSNATGGATWDAFT